MKKRIAISGTFLYNIWEIKERGMIMPASEFTRQAIIDGTKHLASEKPFHKISVLEIVRYCRINRNTFYYYFSDKYDVVQWIFDHEIKPVLDIEYPERSLAESVRALCSFLKTHKGLYMRLLEDCSPCCLRTMLVQYYKNFLIDMAAPHFQAHRLNEDNQEIVARFYAHGTVGMICDWAARDMVMDSTFATSLIQLSAKEKFFV